MFFSYRIPSCGCAVSYGSYFINASIVHDGEAVNVTHGIVLASRGKITYVNITVGEAKRVIDTEDVILLDVRPEEGLQCARRNKRMGRERISSCQHNNFKPGTARI